jgi:hypothetical protein
MTCWFVVCGRRIAHYYLRPLRDLRTPDIRLPGPGTAGPDSDIDVLYTLRPGRQLGWEIEQLADELSELFGSRVDLVSLRSLHPLLKPSVLAGARPVYAA